MLRKFMTKVGKSASIALLGTVILTYLFLSSAAGQPNSAEAAVSDDGAMVYLEARQGGASIANSVSQTWTICNPTRGWRIS